MSEIKINLPDPEDINRQITAAIAASAIGEKLKEAIELEVQRLSSPSNPLKRVVEDEVARLLHQLVRDEYGEAIRAKIKEALTEDILRDITLRALFAWHDQKNT